MPDYDCSEIKKLSIQEGHSLEYTPGIIIPSKIDVISGLDNILRLDISYSKQLSVNIETQMDDETVKRALFKLSEVTISNLHLGLELNGEQKQKSIDVAIQILSSLKISELKLVFKPTYLGGLKVNDKQELINKIMSMKGLRSFEYWASKEKPTYYIRNLQYGRKDLLKLILEKCIT